jgi:hypothetical protein
MDSPMTIEAQRHTGVEVQQLDTDASAFVVDLGCCVQADLALEVFA